MDLFLSYARREDDAFVARLYELLRKTGRSVWWDLREMPARSLTVMQEIRDAIDGVERVVVVLGPRALASDYVPAEWQHALAGGKVVVPMRRAGAFELVPPELRSFPCLDLTPERDEAEAFAELLRVLDDPVPTQGELRGEVPEQTPHFQPRSDALRNISEAVLIDLQPVEVAPNERLTVVHGMGGVGKSVLAAAFARFTSTRRAFSDGVYWIQVGEEADPLAVLRSAAELLNEPLKDYPNLSTGVSSLRKRLQGLKVLIVLDDVWSLDVVMPFRRALDVRTRILVNTRLGQLAAATQANNIPLDVVSEVKALRHLADWIHSEVEDLPDAARQLARACGYLPLALALNGAMLRGGLAWSTLLETLSRAKLDFAEHALADYPHKTVLRAIKVSIDALERTRPDCCKRYRELVVFATPAIPEPAIVRLWARQGGLDELDASKLLFQLEQRALLRLEGSEPTRRIRLHALQHDYLCATGDNVDELDRALLDSYRQTDSDEWASVPDDGYLRRHLVVHLERLGERNEIHALLLAEDDDGTNAWFAANEAIGNLGGYLADLDRARRLEKNSSRDDPEDREAAGRCLGSMLGYAAILASINSLTTMIPGEFRESMLRADLISAEQALAEAHRVSPGWRMKALLSLVPELDDHLARRTLDDALALARSQTKSSRRAWYLARVAHHLSGDVRAQAIEEGLEIAWGIDEPFARSGALAYFLPLVSEAQHSALHEQAMEDFEKAVLSAGPNERLTGPVGELARYGSEQQRNKLLMLVDPVGANLDGRIHLLPSLIQPAADSGATKDDTFDDLLYRALGFSLTPIVGVGLFPRAASFPDALEALFKALFDAGWAFDWGVLSRSLDAVRCSAGKRATIEAAALPCFAALEHSAIVERLWDAVQALDDPDEQRDAMTALGPFWNRDQLRIALASARLIGDHERVVPGLIELLPLVSEGTAAAIRDHAQPLWRDREHLELQIRLAELAPEAWRHGLVEHALDAVEYGAHVGRRSWTVADQGDALASLFVLATPDQQQHAREHLERWIKKQSWPTLQRAFDAIVPHMPREEAETFAADLLFGLLYRKSNGYGRGVNPPEDWPYKAVEALSPLLPADAVPHALGKCRHFRNVLWECAARLLVADRLPAAERPSIHDETFEFFRDLTVDEKTWNGFSVEPLLVLASRLQGARRDEILDRALAWARVAPPDQRCGQLLCVASDFAPAQAGELRREAAQWAHPWQAVKIENALEPANASALCRDALLELLGNWPPRELSATGAYPEALRALAEAIGSHPVEARWSALSEAIDVLTTLPRGEFAVRAATLKPLITSLGDNEPIEQLANGLLDACRWWP